MYNRLLPEKMKTWMVKPYKYEENEEFSSYTMERIRTTDIAIIWTNSAVNIEEFKTILDKTFCFLNSREKKEVSKEEQEEKAKELYINKLKKRLKLEQNSRQ